MGMEALSPAAFIPMATLFEVEVVEVLTVEELEKMEVAAEPAAEYIAAGGTGKAAADVDV